MQTDVQIAQSAHIKHIDQIAEKMGISPDKLEHYGKYKAKINPQDAFRLPEKKGKLILVTAINPTPAGEGKTTVCIESHRQTSHCRHARTVIRSSIRH